MKNLLMLVAPFLLVACSGHPEEENGAEPTKEKQDMFPVTGFIEGQAHLVDSFHLPVVKFTTVNHTTDSVRITPQEFRSLVQEFTTPDITGPAWKQSYEEVSFADRSTPSVTFTYAAKDKALEIQRVDVIIDPNPVSNDKVSSIYMEKIRSNKDTSILKKLYWKTNKGFQIITTTQLTDQPASMVQVKVKWHNPD